MLHLPDRRNILDIGGIITKAGIRNGKNNCTHWQLRRGSSLAVAINGGGGGSSDQPSGD